MSHVVLMTFFFGCAIVDPSVHQHELGNFISKLYCGFTESSFKQQVVDKACCCFFLFYFIHNSLSVSFRFFFNNVTFIARIDFGLSQKYYSSESSSLFHLFGDKIYIPLSFPKVPQPIYLCQIH